MRTLECCKKRAVFPNDFDISAECVTDLNDQLVEESVRHALVKNQTVVVIPEVMLLVFRIERIDKRNVRISVKHCDVAIDLFAENAGVGCALVANQITKVFHSRFLLKNQNVIINLPYI